MIISETIDLNGKNFTRTYSDAGKYITRVEYPEHLYEEAIDPLGAGREYEETDEKIPTEDLSEAERLSALEEETAQNTADIDFIAMACDVDLDE